MSLKKKPQHIGCAHVLMSLYHIYKMIWLPITILGIFSWTVSKACWKHVLNIEVLCSNDSLFDNASHVLFGVWIFVIPCILSFKFLLWKKKFEIGEVKLLVALIFISAILFDCINEFTNYISPEAYKHDLKNTYYDLFGTCLVAVLSVIYLLIKKKRKASGLPNKT